MLGIAAGARIGSAGRQERVRVVFLPLQLQLRRLVGLKSSGHVREGCPQDIDLFRPGASQPKFAGVVQGAHEFRIKPHHFGHDRIDREHVDTGSHHVQIRLIGAAGTVALQSGYTVHDRNIGGQVAGKSNQVYVQVLGLTG